MSVSDHEWEELRTLSEELKAERDELRETLDETRRDLTLVARWLIAFTKYVRRMADEEELSKDFGPVRFPS